MNKSSLSLSVGVTLIGSLCANGVISTVVGCPLTVPSFDLRDQAIKITLGKISGSIQSLIHATSSGWDVFLCLVSQEKLVGVDESLHAVIVIVVSTVEATLLTVAILIESGWVRQVFEHWHEGLVRASDEGLERLSGTLTVLRIPKSCDLGGVGNVNLKPSRKGTKGGEESLDIFKVLLENIVPGLDNIVETLAVSVVSSNVVDLLTVNLLGQSSLLTVVRTTLTDSVSVDGIFQDS